MLVTLGCLGYEQCELMGCSNPKVLLSLIWGLAPASASTQAGALLLALMGSDVNHRNHMQVVQCGISGPDQELARRSLLGKFLCLINTNRRLWEQHSAFIPHDSWQTQDSPVDCWVCLGVRSKIEGPAKSSVLGGQGPRFLYSAFILANVSGGSSSFYCWYAVQQN